MRAPSDFSLVLGGAMYQLWRSTRLSGDTLELLRRRIVVFVLITWAPLLLLSIAEGHAWGGVRIPFLWDIEMHVRFLFVLPLLIGAELIVHQRMRVVVNQFLERGLIPESESVKFEAAIRSATRLRNSMVAEVLLVAFVFIVGIGFYWRTQVALDVASWYGAPDAGGLRRPSLAGWWLGCVSLPVVQFLFLRWYFRIFIWTRFLWQVSRLELNIVPTHPDRSGGLGFLQLATAAFAPLAVAHGAIVTGMISNRIFFVGATLPQFKLELIAIAVLMIAFLLGPLLVFSPKLAMARRAGLREYGGLAQRYVREFDQKWLRAGAPANEPLIGSADIQSLADLGNSFETLRGMRIAPFTLRTTLQVAVVTVSPAAPLLLTMFSLDQLLERLLMSLF